jgi:preprotein translocase subunit SecB
MALKQAIVLSALHSGFALQCRHSTFRDKKMSDEQEFIIQKIYTKDVSFETPNSPAIFQQEWTPETNIELGNEGQQVAEDTYEVALTLTVTAKIGENTAFLVEVTQAGLFTMKGFEEEQLAQMMGTYCPNILFPYARAAISDLVTKGGFPQMLLTPVNFDALYAQHLAEKADA